MLAGSYIVFTWLYARGSGYESITHHLYYGWIAENTSSTSIYIISQGIWVSKRN